MDLTEVTKAAALPYLERYVNGNTRTYSAFSHINDVSRPYQPESDNPSFAIPRFAVPRERLSLFEDSPDLRLRAHYVRDADCYFPVHPDVVNDAGLSVLKACAKCDDLTATPTASTRTAYIAERDRIPAHFLKLHLPRQISRFFRRIRFVTVEFSVAISRDLHDFSADRFAYFPESLGIAIGDRTTGWGFLMRESVPRPKPFAPSWYIPFFSLYATDIRRPADPPLLVQLIRHHDADPLEFTFHHLVQPLVETWCGALRERGIILGAHGENVLLEVDADLRPTRIVHRDLDVQVDPVVRQQRGLHSDFTKSRIGIELSASRQSLYSLKYDSFIGHHLFDYIADMLHRVYRVDPRLLHAMTREVFRNAFPDSDEFFPDTVYYYENKVSPENDVAVVDTGRRPIWR